MILHVPFFRSTLFFGLVLSMIPAVAAAASSSDPPSKKRKVAITDAAGRPYVHVCGAGTEPVGVAGKQMWCRQPVLGGYRRHGAFVEWYANGKRRTAGDYALDHKQGVWTRYYPNGKKREVVEFQNGKEVRRTKYDRRGKAVDDTERLERIKKSRELSKKLREAHSWKKPKDWH